MLSTGAQVFLLSVVRPSSAFSDHRTKGAVIFASGSPYQFVEFEGRVYEPGQGNNMYIFPGIGLGTILARARHVTDAMVEQAAIALSSSLTEEEMADGLVYPRLARIRTISAKIALAVVRTAQAAVRVSICISCWILFDRRWFVLRLVYRIWMRIF